jgi:hypothetical protein
MSIAEAFEPLAAPGERIYGTDSTRRRNPTSSSL